ncbi:hypothetical protein RFI_15636 [Reticulomyxa filosa]|uniref:Uncharacterized protein n=1 Tax=Reticulomyxa filosa TaxID=46433 RepID=X6N8D7_RETFI|nr:hypothetical protein RFI_15636 [Reticulomyxa filosa]|eukprot:ETO21567.1 hypothetical protein RFI_15636 [Reticulomyxa filosa]
MSTSLTPTLHKNENLSPIFEETPQVQSGLLSVAHAVSILNTAASVSNSVSVQLFESKNGSVDSCDSSTETGSPSFVHYPTGASPAPFMDKPQFILYITQQFSFTLLFDDSFIGRDKWFEHVSMEALYNISPIAIAVAIAITVAIQSQSQSQWSGTDECAEACDDTPTYSKDSTKTVISAGSQEGEGTSEMAEEEQQPMAFLALSLETHRSEHCLIAESSDNFAKKEPLFRNDNPFQSHDNVNDNDNDNELCWMSQQGSRTKHDANANDESKCDTHRHPLFRKAKYTRRRSISRKSSNSSNYSNDSIDTLDSEELSNWTAYSHVDSHSHSHSRSNSLNSQISAKTAAARNCKKTKNDQLISSLHIRLPHPRAIVDRRHLWSSSALQLRNEKKLAEAISLAKVRLQFNICIFLHTILYNTIIHYKIFHCFIKIHNK